MAIAVLGAGLLGSGFVLRQLELGRPVVVWNRSPEKVAPLAAAGAVVAGTPAEAVRGVARVHLVLAEDTAVDAVLAAVRPGLADGVPVIDHTTNLPAAVAARFERSRGDGVRYLHAPVFMAPANARAGTGLMLIAGPTGEVEALTPELATMTGKVWHVGERPDLAAVHKLSGNACIIALAGAMGDVLTLGAAHGLSAAETLGLFEHFQPGTSLPFVGKRVANAGTTPASFALFMARKDVRLMLEGAAERRMVVLPAIAAAMDETIAAGHGALDYAVFARPA